jgi:hypothetical protein
MDTASGGTPNSQTSFVNHRSKFDPAPGRFQKKITALAAANPYAV